MLNYSTRNDTILNRLKGVNKIMKDINNSLKLWLEELEGFELTPYEKLPDIDLYMDQMITYLERQLRTFSLSTLDKQITSSMINNYVKGDSIPNPVAKKYNKEHIALILQICLLKRAINISDIKQIMDSTYQNTDFMETYNDFAKKATQTLHEVGKDTEEKLANIETNNQNELLKLALDLSLVANANVLIAKRILNYIEIKNNLEKK